MESNQRMATNIKTSYRDVNHHQLSDPCYHGKSSHCNCVKLSLVSVLNMFWVAVSFRIVQYIIHRLVDKLKPLCMYVKVVPKRIQIRHIKHFPQFVSSHVTCCIIALAVSDER